MGLLNKKNISKSILYYLAEIIIVVAGIFIAIQLNNLNEARKNKIEEAKSLNRILDNLMTEKDVLQQYIHNFEKSRNSLIDIVYNNKTDKLDSISYYFSPFIYFQFNTEYVSLKNSGKLNLITNDTIRAHFVNYNEFYHKKYELLSERHQDIVKNGFFEFSRNEFPTDTISLIDPEIVKPKLNNRKFRNYLIEQINILGDLKKEIEIDKIDWIIEKIEKEKE